MDKTGEVKEEVTPCVVCGHPSEDGLYCADCQRKPKTAEQVEPRSLAEKFIEDQDYGALRGM